MKALKICLLVVTILTMVPTIVLTIVSFDVTWASRGFTTGMLWLSIILALNVINLIGETE